MENSIVARTAMLTDTAIIWIDSQPKSIIAEDVSPTNALRPYVRNIVPNIADVRGLNVISQRFVKFFFKKYRKRTLNRNLLAPS